MDVLPPEHGPQNELPPAGDNTQSSNNSSPGSGNESAEPLSFLRGQPEFERIRHAVQQNPHLLNTVMQQMVQSNPPLLQIISQNQESFVRMLNEPPSDPGNNPSPGSETTTGGEASFCLESSLSQIVAQVSPQDKEATEQVVLPPEHEPQNESPPAGDNTQSSNNSSPESGNENAEPLSFLRGQPDFEKIRHDVYQNPQLLNTMMRDMGKEQPQLLQIISQNLESFVRILNEPPLDPGINSSPGSETVTWGGSGISLESLPSQSTNQISPQDREAIERLKALEFPEHMVIEAYFASERNDNLAADILLSQIFD